MYSPHALYNPHQAFQGVKSSGLYTEKYGIHMKLCENFSSVSFRIIFNIIQQTCVDALQVVFVSHPLVVVVKVYLSQPVFLHEHAVCHQLLYGLEAYQKTSAPMEGI